MAALGGRLGLLLFYRFSSIPFVVEDKGLALLRYADTAAIAETSLQDLFGERILEQLLRGAPQITSSVLLVETLLGNKALGSGCDAHLDIAIHKTRLELLEEDVDDLGDTSTLAEPGVVESLVSGRV